jgi:glycosyltransferase involved in cell wall biosynthesis
LSDAVKSPSVAVILPALNEELTVEDTIRQFARQLPNAQIWVIDNGSDDSTSQISHKTIDDLGCPGGVIWVPNRGKGNAIRAAFKIIEADFYVLADADTTYPAEQVVELLDKCVSGSADMVVGDRISMGSYQRTRTRRFHGLGNAIVVSFVNSLFRSSLTDVMSGYRVMTKSFVKSYPILVSGFEIETDLTLHALDKRFEVAEVAINYQDRPRGSSSKLSTYKDGARVVRTIARIFRLHRPFAFFGALALAFLSGSTVVGGPVVFEWLASGEITKIPSAVLATGLAVFSIVFFAIALILDTLSHYEKKSFELRNLK